MNTKAQPITTHTPLADSISAAMDGELDTVAFDEFVELCKLDPACAKQWQVFHLIGDTLRHTSIPTQCLSARISQHLKDEPTVLAPQKNRLLHKYVTPVAASVAAILLVGWSALNLTATAPHVPVALPVQQAKIDQNKLADFMAAHRDFSPGASSSLMDADYQIPARSAQ